MVPSISLRSSLLKPQSGLETSASTTWIFRRRNSSYCAPGCLARSGAKGSLGAMSVQKRASESCDPLERTTRKTFPTSG